MKHHNVLTWEYDREMNVYQATRWNYKFTFAAWATHDYNRYLIWNRHGEIIARFTEQDDFFATVNHMIYDFDV